VALDRQANVDATALLITASALVTALALVTVPIMAAAPVRAPSITTIGNSSVDFGSYSRVFFKKGGIFVSVFH